MVNINSLERDGLRQAELCPRHTMKKMKNLYFTKNSLLKNLDFQKSLLGGLCVLHVGQNHENRL